MLGAVGLFVAIGALLDAKNNEPFAIWITSLVGIIILPVCASIEFGKWSAIDRRITWLDL